MAQDLSRAPDYERCCQFRAKNKRCAILEVLYAGFGDFLMDFLMAVKAAGLRLRYRQSFNEEMVACNTTPLYNPHRKR